MSNLNNLVEKIKQDGKLKVDQIINEATEKKTAIISKMVKEAESEKEHIVARAQRDGVTRQERILSNATLKVRNEKLRAKGEILDSVFEKALDRLTKLDSSAYEGFVTSTLSNLKLDGDEELLLAESQNEASQLVEKLNAKFKTKLALATDTVSSGFILRKNGIEMNYTFNSIISSARDNLEGEVVSLLF